ncbi:multiple epidermal growth factor-like domains protein 10 [Plodia interpunctella]|uniref:multiple epidermal growth factor-like domains protein 10 n=1 Tax=Plodia interpunctella TaxID=58824 RepID=UPI002368CBAC|nr:multiple epidermal growth factor-like domains protein 10 [Plodia interpunctella]
MMVKRVVFLFVTCCVLELSMAVLKTGDDGVCTVKSSVRKTRTRVVTFYKRCGKKRCIARATKPETFWVTTNQTVCCEGWVYSGEEDTCTPQCTGCLGGRCTAPNVCHCDPPSYLDPEQKNCITPTCSPPCVNAECGQNNTCHCKTDFNPFNATHCFKCEDGYNITSNFECVPICAKKCVNGNCTAPNKCSCLPGFSNKTKDESTCEPVCSKCINSKCTGPDTCSCLDGYSKVNTSYCAPKCEKCDGVCIKPNVCQCREGYSKVKGVCTPTCNETCVNSVCTGPNLCSCFDGYMKRDNSSVCYKSCNKCNSTCRDGACIEKDCSFTQSVPKTKWKGGKRVQYVEKVKRNACCSGWYYNRKEKACKAVCDQGCNGGTCVEPNVCRCPSSLVLKNNMECVPPTCKDPCVNAVCVSDDECMCNPDYIPLNNTHCGPQCLSGFHNDPVTLNCTCNTGFRIDPTNSSNCLPVCDPVCVNATCVSPNTCTCLFGYEQISNTTCSPKCEDCDNGTCIAPNLCQCHDGFSKNSVGKCVPFCSKPCMNGYCIEPETCGCDSGYRPDNKDKYSCAPICKNECVNAVCVAPNKCSCLPGYKGSEESNICRPVCDSCVHGECIRPNVCKCNEGYSFVDGTCSPVCRNVCVNGKCVAPDTCRCNEDYFRNDTNPHVCFKPCLGLCEYGTCDLDGRCLCERGYKAENETCVELKPVNCAACNGTCNDGTCWCQDERQPCFTAETAEVSPTTTLAGMELSFVVAGAVILLLVMMLMIVMQRIYSRRKKMETKASTDYNAYGSVVYTVPNTLTREFIDPDEEEKDADTKSDYENAIEDKQVQKQLLSSHDDNAV